MSICINLEIGHEASLRTKRTPEGFTHDWEVFVRGCDKADIHNFVEKVVFNLHETFPRPKRTLKEPPYSVKESGYAGFTFPIDIYLKNRDEPKVITFDYDLQLQPSGPSISNVQKEKYIFSSVSDDFKQKLLKGGGTVVSISTQDNSAESRHSEEKNQLYNKPNLGGSSSDNSKKHKGGAKGPQSQMPNEPKASSDFVDLFGDYIYKANQTTGVGDTNKGEKPDRGEGKDGRSYKDKISDKDKSKSKQSPIITKDRDKDKSSKQDKPEPPERTKKDDKRNKDRGREKQRDRSKDEKTSNSNSKRDKSPRPKSPSPITKRSLSPKRRTATPSPSPKRPPSPSPSPVQQKQHKSDKRSNESSKDKDKDRAKEDRKRDKKDKRDKEHKENKHKEHRSKDNQAPRKDKDIPKVIEQPVIPTVPPKLDKKDKSNRDKEKDKEKETPKELERVQIVQTPLVSIEKTEKSRDLSTSSSKVQVQPQVVEQIPIEKPSKHKHKKKDKDKKQKDKNISVAKTEKEDKKDKDASKDSRKDKKEKSNKLSIDQFIAEPKSNNFSRSPREDLPKGKSKSIIDDDSSNSSLEDLNDDRFGRDKSAEKVVEPPKLSVEKAVPPEPKKPPPPPQVKPPEVAVPSRKEKPPKPKKDKRQQQNTTEQNDDDNLDGGSSKKKKKRKAVESTKTNHKAEHLMDSDVDPIKSEVASDVNEPPPKIPREEVKETKERDAVKETEPPSSNGKTVNSKKDSKDVLKEVKEDVADDAEDYLKILRELQTKIMSLQDNIELQRVVQLIAETGRYEVSDRTFDFDLCLLDRSTVRQLQEFFANLATT